MCHEASSFAVVAVALPVSRTYHYAIPQPLAGHLEIGHAVLIPFGPRVVSGVVIGLTEDCPVPKERVKPVKQLLTPTPLFSPSLIPFFEWTAEYYHHPLGEVIRTALPPGILVQSSLTVALTPEGKSHLARIDDPGDEIRRLLERVCSRRAQRWTKAVEGLEVARPLALLKQAEDRGWVVMRHEIVQRRTRAKHEQVYRPGMPVSPRDVKGEIQQAIIEILSVMGETDLPSLKEAMAARGHRTGSLTTALKRLEARGLVEVATREVWREAPRAFAVQDEMLTLTGEQSQALQALHQALETGNLSPLLLHGVTGSGKTEVYLRAVDAMLKKGRGALVLVPEIALTPQLVGRFRARFGDRIACLHSGMSAGARFDAWRRLARSRATVAIGARSAVFAPLPDPGLIIVDEEHDASFKQEFGLRYNARDLAIVRGKLARGLVVLGSATPSLETMTNARRGRFAAIQLTSRVLQRPMPEVRIIDMRRPENRPARDDSEISAPLEQALRATIEAGEQAILLLNRRGFAPFVLCTRCGGSFRCTRCDVSLTYHRRRNVLLCHYCGLTVPLGKQCPHCGHPGLTLLGHGTERLERVLEDFFPGTPVGRLDRDTTASRGAHIRILDAFRRRELQILVGTQMVVKGHDFPGVTLVGILQADYALNLPDFRAAERTFQLITQVSGRAGRGARPGKVLVQTHAPNHPTVQLAAQHDFDGFYRREMRVRKAYSYPPYSRLALFQVSAKEEAIAAGFAGDVAGVLRRTCAGLPSHRLLVLGPAPAALGRLKQWYRWQVLVKAGTPRALHTMVSRFLEDMEQRPGRMDVRLAIDIDPQNLL